VCSECLWRMPRGHRGWATSRCLPSSSVAWSIWIRTVRRFFVLDAS
jgi:hypothetical protein